MRTNTIGVVLLAALGVGGGDAQSSRLAGRQKPLQEIKSALPKSPCLPFIPAAPEQRGYGASDFIPLNDAQWTTPGQGYGIALKARGRTAHADGSSVDPLAGTPLEKLKTAFQLTGTSVWVVMAAHTMEELLGQ